MKVSAQSHKIGRDMDKMFLELLSVQENRQTYVFNKVNTYIKNLSQATSVTSQQIADSIANAYVKQGFLKSFPDYGKLFDKAILEQYQGLVSQLPKQMLDNLNLVQKEVLKLKIGGDLTSKQALDLITNAGDFRGFTFTDRSGRNWKFETLMNRLIRDQGKQATRFASENIARDLGTDIFQVSSHAGARPKCAIDQGKLYSPTGGTFKDLNGKEVEVLPWGASSEGQGDGLFGYNCRHIKYPMVQGFSIPSKLDPLLDLSKELNKDLQVKS